MKKTVSIKDILVFLALTLIIILILLAMYQVDRQWQKLSDMERALSEQTKDVSNLRGNLNTIQRQLANVNLQANSAEVRNKAESVSDPSASGGMNKTVSRAFERALNATRQADYAQGDWSVNALGGNLKTITPFVSTDADASDIQSYILESLITRDPDTLEWTGLIARDWTVSEDGLIITFRLRDDVYFSDGEPLDSSDAVFTYNFMMNDKIQAPRHRAYYDKIKSVAANGPYELIFTFKEPYFEALELAGGLEIMPEHFYSEFLEKPETFNESKGLLMGSGPYQLTDPKGWTPDQGNVELVRNHRYWGDVQPSFERILWRVIQNASARLTTYRNGDIDAYGARPVEYEKLKDDAQIMAKSQNFEYMNPVASYSYLGWNQEKEGKPTLFADKRIRQAMTFLTDRKRISDDIYLGYAETAISPFSPRSEQHDPQLEPREYSLDKAKALLREVGYEDRDDNGVLENRDGEPFEFKLTYFQDNEDTKRMVLLLKDLYAKAGVKLIPNPQEWPVMLEMLNKKNFEAITLAWTSGIETDIYQMFHSSQAKTNGDNFINYRNEKLDKIIDQARSTVDEKSRMPLWREAERIMYEDQPYTFLFRRQTLAFIDTRIKNVKLTKLGLNRGRLPMEQYVPKAIQKYTR